MPGTPRKNIYFAIILIARSLVSRSSGDRLSTNAVEVLVVEIAGTVFRERILERTLLLVMQNVLSELFPDKHVSDSSQKHSSLPDALKRFCHHPPRKAKKLQTKPGNESVPWCQQCHPPVQNLVVSPALPLSGDGNDRMRYQRNRFTSFHRIPQTDLPPETRPIGLAGCGFYFDGNQRWVLCFSCGARYPDHHPDCTWRTENVPFCQPPSPQPIRCEESPLVMGVKTRPAHQASPANNSHPPGNAPPLPGYQPDGPSMLSDYSASPDNRPIWDPIRRHVTSGEEDEGALRRMEMDDTLLASSAIARGRDITEDQKEPAAKLPHQTTRHASEPMSSVTTRVREDATEGSYRRVPQPPLHQQRTDPPDGVVCVGSRRRLSRSCPAATSFAVHSVPPVRTVALLAEELLTGKNSLTYSLPPGRRMTSLTKCFPSTYRMS